MPPLTRQTPQPPSAAHLPPILVLRSLELSVTHLAYSSEYHSIAFAIRIASTRVGFFIRRLVRFRDEDEVEFEGGDGG